MCWKKRSDRPEPKTPFTVHCAFGCTRLDCGTLHEAEVFQKRMGRCPQCGGELTILLGSQQEKS